MNLGLIPKLDFDVKNKCEVCVESKFARYTYKTVQGRISELLDLIHTDICDFKSLPTRGGKNYFITFIDDCSKYCYVYLIKSKDEALGIFKICKAEIQNQLGRKIKGTWFDRGRKNESDAIENFVLYME